MGSNPSVDVEHPDIQLHQVDTYFVTVTDTGTNCSDVASFTIGMCESNNGASVAATRTFYVCNTGECITYPQIDEWEYHDIQNLCGEGVHHITIIDSDGVSHNQIVYIELVDLPVYNLITSSPDPNCRTSDSSNPDNPDDSECGCIITYTKTENGVTTTHSVELEHDESYEFSDNNCSNHFAFSCASGLRESGQRLCLGKCIVYEESDGYTYQWWPEYSATPPCPDTSGVYPVLVTTPDSTQYYEFINITIEQPPTITLETRNCTLDDPEDCTCVLEAYSAVDASGNPIEVKPYLESDGRTWTIEIPYGNKCVLKESSTCIQSLGPQDDDDKMDHNNVAPDTPQIDLDQSEDKKTLYFRSNTKGKLRASLHDIDNQEILHVDLEASSPYEMLPIDVAHLPPGNYDIRITDAHGDMLYTERIAIPRAETLSPQSRDYPTGSGSNNK